jgi:hypothetical protein
MNWCTHRLALERWRDAYAGYQASRLAKDANSIRLYDRVRIYLPEAENALKAANAGVAAENEKGEMEYGLAPLIRQLQKRLGATGRTNSIIRISQTFGDGEDVPKSAAEALLATVDRAIDDLKEREASER